MQCKRCTYCCTLSAKLSLFEYLRILLKGYKDFADRNAKGQRHLKLINNKCYFLKDKHCKIYNIRPKMCREYPGVDKCPNY